VAAGGLFRIDLWPWRRSAIDRRTTRNGAAPDDLSLRVECKRCGRTRELTSCHRETMISTLAPFNLPRRFRFQPETAICAFCVCPAWPQALKPESSGCRWPVKKGSVRSGENLGVYLLPYRADGYVETTRPYARLGSFCTNDAACHSLIANARKKKPRQSGAFRQRFEETNQPGHSAGHDPLTVATTIIS